ncbi:hypothetical protein FACS1894186_8610 [Alphaproteobacteria bacterium]|nr:hypothetical protein FACS1894186_8610 [Alphaproteobacteria bacterium]
MANDDASAQEKRANDYIKAFGVYGGVDIAFDKDDKVPPLLAGTTSLHVSPVIFVPSIGGRPSRKIISLSGRGKVKGEGFVFSKGKGKSEAEGFVFFQEVETGDCDLEVGNPSIPLERERYVGPSGTIALGFAGTGYQPMPEDILEWATHKLDKAAETRLIEAKMEKAKTSRAQAGKAPEKSTSYHTILSPSRNPFPSR